MEHDVFSETGMCPRSDLKSASRKSTSVFCQNTHLIHSQDALHYSRTLERNFRIVASIKRAFFTHAYVMSSSVAWIVKECLIECIAYRPCVLRASSPSVGNWLRLF